MGPLDGVRVVDFSRVVSGPFCTMLLGDLGAEVVKIESPDGDETRRIRKFDGRRPQDEDFFYAVNRNKKSVVLDLKQQTDRTHAEEMISTADILVENFAPGTMARLGLDYGSVTRIRPDIIYCAISGFGHDSPYSSWKAYDTVIQAFSGVMRIHAEDEVPRPFGLLIGDMSSALYAFGAIVVALYARTITGEGTFIDLSMADALLSLWGTVAAEFLANGQLPRGRPTRSPAGTYLCSDGIYIAVMASSEKMWPAFCIVMGLEELLGDPRLASNTERVAHSTELDQIIDNKFAQRPRAEWLALLRAAGIACAPVNTLRDALTDPHFEHRSMELQIDHPVSGTIRTINNPLRMTGYRTWRTIPPPLLGQDEA